MHVSLLPLFECPHCRKALDARILEREGDQIRWGSLHCAPCGFAAPVLDGLLFFTEATRRPAPADAAELQALAARLFGSAADFQAYHRERWRRGSLEAYAAFHPFNESTRALAPLLPHAEALLSPGDVVLDLWCRTGWSGEWLAARLPAQRVLSVWEGNSSVMGYRGFRYLMQERPANLDVCFLHPGGPWPLRDGAVSLLHAADCLHRYPWPHLGEEALRVTRRDGALLFPHVHLSNSEPEPWFERGGCHRHGREYRHWLDAAGPPRAAEGRVLSELAVFEGPAVATLQDESEGPHYNGVLLILPGQRPPPAPVPAPDAPGDRFAVSPLFRLALARGSWRAGPTLHGGAVAHLLERHPAYAALLPEGPVPVTDAALMAGLLALLGETRAGIRARFTPGVEVAAGLSQLVQHEVLRPAALSLAGHRLQRFHANQLPPEGATPQAFFAGLAAVTSAPFALGGEPVSGADLDQLARLLWPVLDARCRDGWLSIAGRQPLSLWLAVVAAAGGLQVRLQRDRADAHPDSALCVAEQGPLPARGVLLGLEGETESLLSLLPAEPAPPALPLRGDGVLQVPVAGGHVRLSLAELLEMTLSLRHQQESRFLALTGESAARDLLMLLTALQAPAAGR